VTTFANDTSIQNKTITLTSKNSTTVTFTWSTTGFAKGNYTISAYAWPLPNEVNEDNNRLTNGSVLVSIPGDVDGDINGGQYDVFLYDAVKLLACYGFKEDTPGYNPNCDIDDDGRIFLYDAVILLSHYGEKYP
jgi:hypothetical protein